MMMD